jgi:hypothetical protein
VKRMGINCEVSSERLLGWTTVDTITTGPTMTKVSKHAVALLVIAAQFPGGEVV